MKNFKSRSLALLIVAILVIVNAYSILIDVKGATNDLAVSDGNFHVTINGRVVQFNDLYGYPKLTKGTGRTLVPLRIISENMGYGVDWEAKTKTATINGGGSVVKVSIGETTALVNGKRVAIDVDDKGNPLKTSAMLLTVKGDKNPRTYVPLRFISETTGADIQYKNVNGVHHITITIRDGTPIVPDPEPEPEAGYVGKVKFNPTTDVMKDGRLTHEKTRDFLDEMMKNIKVTKEGGSYYLEWKEIPLPAGQEYTLAFDTAFNRTTTDLGHHLTTSNSSWVKEEDKLQKRSFKIKLDNKKMSDIRFYKVSISVYNPNRVGVGDRDYSARYSIDYNPNTKSATITPYNKWGTTMPDETFDKSIIFGPGL